jgi:peptidoglycan/LPS O-acetylase OafA/YrhL
VNFRSDVNGLRGIAILLVVLFHAYPNQFSLGSFGVDIFFVISGYLIAKKVIGEQTKRFSFVHFYASRVIRIFPSLLGALSLTLLVTFLFFPPEVKRSAYEHISISGIFINNFVLAKEVGYFDSSSSLKPLLHLWSLAVEVQFYVVAPFLVFAKKSLKRRIILATSIVSFLFSIFMYSTSPSIGFYLPFARFWEFGAGFLVALGRARIKLRVDLISIPLLFIPFLPMPSFNNPYGILLFAVIPTALFLYPSDSRFRRAIFDNKILQYLGNISFPLYLSHWIMFSSIRVITGKSLTSSMTFQLLVASIFISHIALVILERPAHKLPRMSTSILLIFAMILLSLGSLVLNRSVELTDGKGTFRRADEPLLGSITHDFFHAYIDQNFYACSPENIYSTAPSWDEHVRCNQSYEGDKIDVILVGDSHAEHLFPGLANAAKTKNIAYYIQPGLGLASNPAFNGIFENIVSNESIRTVVLSNKWEDYQFRSIDLLSTVQILLEAKKRVFIFDDVPTFKSDPSLCKYKFNCQIDLNSFKTEHDSYSAKIYMRQFENIGVPTIPVYKALCDDLYCSMRSDNSVLYRDWNHLNLEGSDVVAKWITSNYPSIFND